MVRIVGLLLVLALAAAITYGVFALAKNGTQRKLYRHNPELSDLPRSVVKRLAQQEQQLDRAAATLRGLLQDEINVFLPAPHKARVQQWLTTHQKEINP